MAIADKLYESISRCQRAIEVAGYYDFLVFVIAVHIILGWLERLEESLRVNV